MEVNSPDMVIVIPIGPNDLADLNLLTDALLKLGHIGQHRILLAAVPSMFSEAESVQRRLAPISDSIEVVNTGNEFNNGWPIGPDRMWHWTVTYLDSVGNSQPWLWLECDACPIKQDWANTLANAYRSAGKPFFGHARPTKWKNPDGTTFTQAGDINLRGVAIYPPMISRDKEIYPLLNNLAYEAKQVHPAHPWDIYLRWQFNRRGIASSPTIYDRWKTCNYVRDAEGIITCEVFQGADSEGGVIPDSAVLVHGCKDGTLHRLVSGKKDMVPVKTPIIPESVAVKEETPVAPEPNVFNFTLTVGTDNLTETERLVLSVIEAESRPRIGAIVAKTGVSKADMLALLPNIGYKMKAAGWLEKETQEL